MSSTLFRALALLAILFGLSACYSTPEVDYPDDSVGLRQNTPTPVEGLRVIASNFTEDSVHVSVSNPGDGQMADGDNVSVGDTATIHGLTFTLVGIELGTPLPWGQTGSDGSVAWILPAD